MSKKKEPKFKFVFYLILALIWTIGVILTIKGEKYKISTLVSLGTGLITSGIITVIFNWLIAKQNKINKRMQRKKFFKSSIINFYDLIMSLNITNLKNVSLKNSHEFIHANHRYYHEYYKRMIANYKNSTETLLRMDDIDEFIHINNLFFEKLKNTNYLITEEGFDENEIGLIDSLSEDYYQVKYFYEKSDELNAIYYMAMLLNTIARVLQEVNEYKLLNAMQFEFNECGALNINKSELYTRMTLIKFIDEFRNTRSTNYKKNYQESKTDTTKE